MKTIVVHAVHKFANQKRIVHNVGRLVVDATVQPVETNFKYLKGN